MGNTYFFPTAAMVARTRLNVTLYVNCTSGSNNSQIFVYTQCKGKGKSPVTGLEWPKGFQKVKVLKFHYDGTGWW